MMPRLYAIFAHHDQYSFNAQIFNAATDALEQNKTFIDRLVLYDRAAEIPFYTPYQLPEVSPLKGLSESAFFHENKERFLAADYLFIVYPIYWYSTPGILKCWLDLITNFAWKYESGPRAKALHKIKHVFVVQTSFQSWWRRRFLDGDLERRQLSKTFDFIGIKRYTFYDIGSVHTLSDQQKKVHLEKVVSQCLKLFHQ